MDLQTLWTDIQKIPNSEIVQNFSNLTEEQKYYIRIRSNLKIAEMHYSDIINKPNQDQLKQKIIVKNQSEKIIKYTGIIKKLEKNQNVDSN